MPGSLCSVSHGVMRGKLKTVEIILGAAIVLSMMAATFIDRLAGHAEALRTVYHSAWFIALWAAFTIIGLCDSLSVRKSSPQRLRFQIPFAVILAGALITHLHATDGIIHLRVGDSADYFVTRDGMKKNMPFSVSLDDFRIDYYQGTGSPKDYVSMVTADDRTCSISMNSILRLHGYRFYQTSYDEDESGTVLTVVHDPAGIAVTYVGYLIMVLAIVSYFFKSDTTFRTELTARSGASIPKWLNVTSLAVCSVIGIWLTVRIAVRWHASGHIPMTNGSEMMLMISWTAILLTAVLRRKSVLITPVGITVSLLALLVSHLAEPHPDISPIPPVLDSPLLALHVGCMMTAYALFGIIALCGLAGIILHRNNDHGKLLAGTNAVMVFPAEFLLAVGTILGAVWANISWGSYWSWDPKETWALISLMVYLAAFGRSQSRLLSSPLGFNIFCFSAFLCILFTYFGVNFYLGGIHSYT